MKETRSRTGLGRIRRGAVAGIGAASLVASSFAGLTANAAVPSSNIAAVGATSVPAANISPLSSGGLEGYEVPATAGQPFEVYVEPGGTVDVSAYIETIHPEGIIGDGVRVHVIDGQGTEWMDEVVPVSEGPEGGFEILDLASQFPDAEPGVWQIDLSSRRNGEGHSNTVVNWEINAYDASGNERDGRVWTGPRGNRLHNYVATQYGFANDLNETADDVTLYYASESGVQYRSTYRDFQGFQSYFGANSIGLAHDDCTPAYTSSFGANYGQSPYNSVSDCEDAQIFRVFFEEPDNAMPATAPRGIEGGAETWVNPDYVPPAFPTLTATPANEDNYGNTLIEYTLEGQPGLVTIEVDTTGSGDFVNPVVLQQTAALGANSITWNGSSIPRTQAVHVRVYIENTGEIHFVNIDVELRGGGLELEQLTGPGAPQISDLYWDDTEISSEGLYPTCAAIGGGQDETADCATPNPETEGELVGDGVSSAGGVHGWAAPAQADHATTGTWGNVRIVDDWTFIDDSAESEIVLIPAEGDPALAINKEQVGDPVISEDGESATITWLIEAGNLGEGDATDVVVTDTLPEETLEGTLEVVDGPSQGDFDVDTATWTVGDLAAGQEEQVTLSADVALSGEAQVFVNQARIGNPDFPPPGEDEVCVPNDDLPGDTDQCDEVETPIEPPPVDPADVRIHKDTVDVVVEDGLAVITWSVDVDNAGPGVATEVTVSDILPDEVDADSIEIVDGPSQGNFDTGSMVWSVGTLEVNQSESVVFSGAAPLLEEESTVVNAAWVTAPEDPREPPVDPTDPEECVPNEDLPGDDDNCDLVETPLPPQGQPDLKIHKTTVGEPVLIETEDGDLAFLVEWTIEAGNLGDAAADDVTVTDTLPEQVDPATVVVTDGPSQGEFDLDSLVWFVGTLDVDQVETMSFTGLVDAEYNGEIIVNTAVIENPDFPVDPEEPCVPNDDLPGDDDQCDFVEVPIEELEPDLKINKLVEGAPVYDENGEFATITWTIEAGNFGDITADDVVVTDVLPDEYIEGTLNVLDGPSVGDFDLDTAIWTVGSMEPGAVETITFSSDVTLSGDEQTIVNKAYIENPDFPVDPEGPCVPNDDLPGDDDQCDLEEVPVDPANPDLKIHKRTDAVDYGDDAATITWTIEAGNFGGAVAEEVFVGDVLPEEVDPSTVNVVDGPSAGEFNTDEMVWLIGDMAPGAVETVTFTGDVAYSDEELDVVNIAYIANPDFPVEPGEPCVPNDDLVGDDDRCDYVVTPIDPEDPVDPPVDPKPPVDPPVDPPTKPEPPVVPTGDPVGSQNGYLVALGILAMLGAAAGAIGALRKKNANVA